MTTPCPCGCSGASMSRLYRRARGIGDAAAAAGTVVQQFNVGQYVPSDVQTDYATAKSYYDTFSQAAQGVSVVNGRVELSPAAQTAAADAIAAGVAAAVPVLGAAYAALWALAPHAGPGPGVCATSPPRSANLADLQAWPNFHSWASFFKPYPAAAPGTFEAYGNPMLEYNWLLNANCFSSKAMPPQAMLALLIASWNQTHAGPTRQICRHGLNPPSWGLGPDYDPIANALEGSLSLTCPPNAPTDAFGVTVPCGPFNVTSCFAVNNGPQVQKVLALTLRAPHPSTPTPAIVSAKAPASGASPGAVATVAVLSLAAAAGLYVHRHPKSLAKLRRSFGKR